MTKSQKFQQEVRQLTEKMYKQALSENIKRGIRAAKARALASKQK